MSFIGSGYESEFDVENDSGDFTGISKWNPIVPGINQWYEMQLGYEIQQDPHLGIDIGIAVANWDNEFADAMGIEPGLGISFYRGGSTTWIWQHMTLDQSDLEGAEAVLLRLDFDDDTDEFTAGFSLDGRYQNFPDSSDLGWGQDTPGHYEWYFSGQAIELQEIQPLQAFIDIKPGGCPNPVNINSKGVLPVAILGTDELDVSNIDPETITLEGVAPLRYSMEDVAAPVVDGLDCDCTTEGPDGYVDLTLKFDTQQVIGALGEVECGQEYILYLTGELNDETPIEGSDCILLVPGNGSDVDAAIDQCWRILQTIYAASMPSSGELGNWFDTWAAEGYVDGGRDAAQQLSHWLSGEGPGVGITISLEIVVPLDVTGTSYVQGYLVEIFYFWPGESGSFLTAMVFDGTKWLWFGDQMWLSHIEFVPHAQMQTDIDDNVAFYTGFGIQLWDDTFFAYNHGARSAIITGPGLPMGGQILEHYYPEPNFRLYPKGAWGHPSGGWGLWLDDTAISAIPDNATYTISIYEEPADTVSLSDTPLQSYTRTFPKGPVLNSELNTSLFPALITPSSHDESVLDVPGFVDVSWTNPSNMEVDWTALGLHSPDWSIGYLIDTEVFPGDTSAIIDTTGLPEDVLANHLYMHGTDSDGRRFGFGWDLF